MKEELITFETAKLAKEKGFKEVCEKSYQLVPKRACNGMSAMSEGYFLTISPSDCNTRYELLNAPTQSLLQKWLREKHNIQVQAYYDEDAAWQWCIDRMNKSEWYDKGFHFKIYEEALEKGLQEALNLITL